MLTDYERYQLEWMIEHGHSLDELMAELTYYQNDLEATRGVNLTVSEVFDAWTSDRGFVPLENDVITKDMIRAGIEHGVIRFEANPDPNDPWKTVCAIGNGWFYHVDTTDIPPDEYIRMNSRNVDMVVDEIYDELNSTVKSDYHDDFKRYLAVLNEEHHGGTNSLTGIPFDINETMENGGAYYNPERGIVIASFLLEQTSPRIEAYYGYTPYAQAPSHDDADVHEDGCAVLREAVQVTSHGRVMSSAVHERPVSIHGESTRARAAAAVLAAHVDAEEEAEEKEDKHRER